MNSGLPSFLSSLSTLVVVEPRISTLASTPRVPAMCNTYWSTSPWKITVARKYCRFCGFRPAPLGIASRDLGNRITWIAMGTEELWLLRMDVQESTARCP